MDGINDIMNQYAASYTNSSSSKLENRLKNKNDESTDEEMMQACKEFEQYFVEKMYKEMKKTIPEDSLLKDNEYMNMFEDKLVESVAEKVSDSNQIGIAKQIYEAMMAQKGNVKITDQ